MMPTHTNSKEPATVQNNANIATPAAAAVRNNINTARPAFPNNSVKPLAKPPLTRRSTPQTVENKSDLVCKVKYGNTLPDIPFDLKFLKIPNNINRFISYKPTYLEQSYKFDIIPENDLGLNIDLVNKDKYSVDYNGQLEVEDEILLEENIFVPQNSKRSKYHAKNVSWLRRTEYISTEQTRFQPQTIEKVEAKVGFNMKKNFKEETLYVDRDSQIKAIEKTFEDNKQPIEKHHSKPNVQAVETLNIFPDFKNWKYPCAQVIFDSDPAPTDHPVSAQIEGMSRAMIRGVMDENDEQFVAYFLPSKETIIQQREDAVNGKSYEENFPYDYIMTREYNWNVKSKNENKGYEENYFLIERPDGLFYNELEARVRLSKRRQKVGAQSSIINTKLIVEHVPVKEAEIKVYNEREKKLKPYDEEEEAAENVTIDNLEEAPADLDNDISDVDDDNTVNLKHENNESKTYNNSDSYEHDTKSKVTSRSGNKSDSDTSDKEDSINNKESSSSGMDEESKEKRLIQDAVISKSNNGDVKKRSKNNSERTASVANSDSFDKSDLESNRDLDSE